jgi:hypothetical protein
MKPVERGQRGVRLARLFYAVMAVIALILAIGIVAPAVLGSSGGCHVVLQFGAPGTVVPATINPASPAPASINALPQASPGPGVPRVAYDCVVYVDVTPALVAAVLGVALLLAVARLARGPERWGLTVAVGATAGIVAALLVAYAVIGIATSDQPQSSPGLGTLLVAVVPLLAALGCAFAIWRAHADGEGTHPG